MSRGGRSGRFQGGRPRGPNLPFDVDPELLEAVDQAEEEARSSEDDFAKELFPVPTEYITAAPITESERRGVQLERRIQAKRRAGPFWTGARDQWAEIDAKSGGSADPFEGIATYSRKRTKKPFQLANLKRVKVCYPQFFPKELQSVVTDTAVDGTDLQLQRKKILGLAKKSAVDKLAKFDEDETRPDVNEIVASEDEEDRDADDDDDIERSPQDDDFDDDDEELDNDYNAEKYFDDGEDDFDEGDAEDYGGDDGY